MTWNYRVCSETVGEGEFRGVMFTIREVFYGEDGKVHSYSGEPTAPFGETAVECADAAARMAGCLALGVLDLDTLNFGGAGEQHEWRQPARPAGRGCRTRGPRPSG